jgi:hypothetical protein
MTNEFPELSVEEIQERLNQSDMRPVIAIPMERTLAYADKVIWSWLKMAQRGFPFIKQGYQRTSLARNRFAIQLLQSNYTHVIMLDADHIHPVDTLDKLLRWFVIDDDIMVVGGMNFRRGEPYDPCCYFQGDDGKYYPPAEWSEGLLKVDALGCGSICIDRRVFEIMEPPWFFDPLDKVWANIWPGEDIGFSQKCNEYGIDLYVDTTATSPHIIEATVERKTFEDYKRQHNIKVDEIENFVTLGRRKDQPVEP